MQVLEFEGFKMLSDQLLPLDDNLRKFAKPQRIKKITCIHKTTVFLILILMIVGLLCDVKEK